MKIWLPALVSLVTGAIIMGFKVWAAYLTNSSAVLSDALESLVNVAAAAFALGSTAWAAQPADKNHPYGHGKMEYVSAAFEGGLVALAALLMAAEGVRALWHPRMLQQLGLGLYVTLGCGVANLLLGLWLLRRGRALGSMALEADGHHVMSDVWTTVGVGVGLGLVALTGWTSIDPLASILMGAWLLRQGSTLVRRAMAGLLDEEDTGLVQQLQNAFAAAPVAGVERAHNIRTIRSGRLVHVDAHLHVPADWSVAQAHAAGLAVEAFVKARVGFEGDVALHMDPLPKT